MNSMQKLDTIETFGREIRTKKKAMDAALEELNEKIIQLEKALSRKKLNGIKARVIISDKADKQNQTYLQFSCVDDRVSLLIQHYEAHERLPAIRLQDAQNHIKIDAIWHTHLLIGEILFQTELCTQQSVECSQHLLDITKIIEKTERE